MIWSMAVNDIKTFFSRYASSYALRFIFLFLSYIAIGKATVLFHSYLDTVGHIWPAGGIALVFIFIWGYSAWPAIFLASLFLNAVQDIISFPLMAQAVANSLEPMLVAYFCLRSPTFDYSLNKLQDIFRGLVASVLSGFVGAVIVAAGVLLSGYQITDLFPFLRYWAGHSLAFIMLTPLILVFSRPNLLMRLDYESFKKTETIIFSTAFFCATGLYLYYEKLVYLYLFFPLVLWSALRFGQRGAMLIAFALNFLVVFQAALKAAHIGTLEVPINEIYLSVFVVALQLTGLIAGAFVLEQKVERQDKEKSMLHTNSELEKTMNQLKEAKEAAEAASAAKTAFLANVSHEIRTPLGAVLGFSDLILANNMSETEKKKIYKIIKRNGLQLLNVINDILDLSKVEAGKFEIQKRAITMDEIFEDVRSTMDVEADKKGISLKIIREPNVPKKIFTDPIRLRQILFNIIGNAIKFTDRGSVDLLIKTIVDNSGLTKLAFIVKDTGIGIPSDKVKELFAPFTQVDVTSTRRFGGTGLGLALSRRLAMALGGGIELTKTTLGQGSEFMVTIDPGDTVQIEISEKKLQEETSLQTQKITSSKNLANKKILLVEDNLDNQSLFMYYIRSAGADVIIANNGLEALQKVHNGQYDIILMDLQMPEMDGYEATKILRNEGYKKTIIALSAHAMKEVRERCLAGGFDGYVSKPVERGDLLQVLTDFVVESKKSEKSLTELQT